MILLLGLPQLGELFEDLHSIGRRQVGQGTSEAGKLTLKADPACSLRALIGIWLRDEVNHRLRYCSYRYRMIFISLVVAPDNKDESARLSIRGKRNAKLKPIGRMAQTTVVQSAECRRLSRCEPTLFIPDSEAGVSLHKASLADPNDQAW